MIVLCNFNFVQKLSDLPFDLSDDQLGVRLRSPSNSRVGQDGDADALEAVDELVETPKVVDGGAAEAAPVTYAPL